MCQKDMCKFRTTQNVHTFGRKQEYWLFLGELILNIFATTQVRDVFLLEGMGCGGAEKHEMVFTVNTFSTLTSVFLKHARKMFLIIKISSALTSHFEKTRNAFIKKPGINCFVLWLILIMKWKRGTKYNVEQITSFIKSHKIISNFKIIIWTEQYNNLATHCKNRITVGALKIIWRGR